MNRLKSCVIIADEIYFEDWNNYLRQISNGQQPTEDIYRYTVKDGVRLFLTSQEELRNRLNTKFDLVIIEDSQPSALLLAIFSAKCSQVNNLIIASSKKCVEYLLKNSLSAPPLVTLDFHLESPSNEQRDNKSNFKLTEDLYNKLKNRWPNSKIIGVTGWIDPNDGEPNEDAKELVSSLRRSGDDMFPKGDIFYKSLPYLIRNAVENYRQKIENGTLKTALELKSNENEFLKRVSRFNTEDILTHDSPVDYIIGNSAAMKIVYYFLHRFKDKPVVSIYGETGTGKDLIARALHDISRRKTKPFVRVDCAKLNDSAVLDSELFGHEKGAYTGAFGRRIGLVESANGGTVFFDEIGEISNQFQDKLLGLIERKKFTRVGGNREISVDINIITATNKNLSKFVDEGRFKNDLYGRLTTRFPTLPRLKERDEDVQLLADHFLEQINENLIFSNEAYAALRSRQWGRNIRELKTVIEESVIFLPDGINVITPEMLVFEKPNEDDARTAAFPGLTNARMMNTWLWLDALEKACNSCERVGNKLTQVNVCAHLITPSGTENPARETIPWFFKDFGIEIATICEGNPHKWIMARGLTGFPK